MATPKNQKSAAQEKDSGTKPEDTQAQQQPEEQKTAGDENKGDTSAQKPEEQNVQEASKPEEQKPQETKKPEQQKPSEDPQQPEEQKTAAQSNERKTVTFLRPFSRYTRGDIAGFEPKEAERLVKKRVAVEGTKLPAQTDNQEDEPKA